MFWVLLVYALFAGVLVFVIPFFKREEDSRVLTWITILSFIILSVGALTLAVSGKAENVEDYGYIVLIAGPLIPMVSNICTKLPDRGDGADVGSIRFVNFITLLMAFMVALAFAIREGLFL
jgi:uncharacterized membrane protein YeiB